MLNNVPTQINRSKRLVTLKHPNSMDCTVYRKEILRVADTPAGDIGGLPTIGGIGTLDSEDEADYTYILLGNAKIHFSGAGPTSAGRFNEADNQLIEAGAAVAAIECIIAPGEPGYFVPDKKDMVMVEPGPGIAYAYEINDLTSNCEIPPYTRTYGLVPRSDADVGT